MIRREFLRRCGAILTGSVAFGVATHNSDEDWLIYVEKEAVQHPSFIDNDDNYPPGFSTVREGNINLIVAHTKDFHDRWMKAHQHCVIERPRDKSRRIRIFRHYLYGEALI